MTIATRLFREADRQERLAMLEEAARIERINAILDRSLRREPEAASVALIVSAAFSVGCLLVIWLAPAETWAVLGY